MSGSERRTSIVRHLHRVGRDRIAALAERFDVSPVTIRTDLTNLERSGLVSRLHGSVALTQSAVSELAFTERRSRNLDAKALIGSEAAKLITDGEAIILDAGTTTLEVARNLKDRGGLDVLTNGLDIACELAKSPEIDVSVLGGRVRRSALSCSGTQAAEVLSHCRFDRLFLGVEAIDPEIGIVSTSDTESVLNRAMMAAAREIVAVTDGSKVGRRGIYRVAGFAEIHRLITDDAMPLDLVEMFRRGGVEVTICRPAEVFDAGRKCA